MKIKAEQLQSHLQKQLLPVYVVSGEEPLLAQESADAVRIAARAAGFAERELFHVEGNYDWNQLINESNSLSLFADKKILEIRIANGKPGDKGSKALCEICANLNPDNLLLIVLPKLERAAQNSKWIKALESVGAHIQVWPVSATQLPRWIQQRLQQAGIQANQEAVQILADRVEGNLLAAVQEIEKLKLLALDGKVDASRMSAVVADSARYNLFEFIDRVLMGDAQSAARSLRGLQNEGIEIIPLLWSITRELRILVKASEQVNRGAHSDAALKSAGVWDKRIPLFRSALRRLSPAHLRMLLHQAGAIDRGIKGQRQADVWEEITTLVLSLAGSQTLQPANIKVLLDS
ncbi:MAG: DNA polymerase III subunit delta [Porticoccaceae bacterium]|nr:DNA polymerase III subunit delta [Porticoccaceae bacterium]MBT5577164.1 DNA polymerase III subunit delta [Porticoccaceae bacterium]MBT7375402.1 DNA polymerase III subunit delta [Porticoccaceae bacterium]